LHVFSQIQNLDIFKDMNVEGGLFDKREKLSVGGQRK
jgi:hypothetical protein